MSPEALSRFKLRSAAERNHIFGTTITFRGQQVRACVSSAGVTLDLAEGGMRQSGDLVCRFLSDSLTSSPKRGETLLFGSRSYVITQTKDNIVTPGEYLCTISPGSAL